MCSEIKETAGAEIDFKHLVLDFFPHPHLIFDQVTLAVPPGVRGKAASIRIRPKDLVADLFPDAPVRIADAPANLTIDFKMNEPWQLQAELNGSSPHLKFRTAKDQQLNPAKTCLVGKTFKADETYNVKGTLDNIHIYSPAPSAVA